MQAERKTSPSPSAFLWGQKCCCCGILGAWFIYFLQTVFFFFLIRWDEFGSHGVETATGGAGGLFPGGKAAQVGGRRGCNVGTASGGATSRISPRLCGNRLLLGETDGLRDLQFAFPPAGLRPCLTGGFVTARNRHRALAQCPAEISLVPARALGLGYETKGF